MSGEAGIMAFIQMIRPRKSTFAKLRVGSLGDGGYVVPDDLAGISHVLSIGVGNEVSFDLHFAKLGIPVIQYDPSVEGPPLPHPQFSFHRLAWQEHDDDRGLCLASMLERHELTQSNNLILKFDVEGAEWAAIRSVGPDTLKHFRLVTCELHGLQRLFDAPFLAQARYLVQALTAHHTVVHLHANNCCGISLIDGVPVPAVIEITLLRNDRSEFWPCFDPIPGPLDFRNMTDRPDLTLNAFGS
jgi:hypothetical protein